MEFKKTSEERRLSEIPNGGRETKGSAMKKRELRTANKRRRKNRKHKNRSK